MQIANRREILGTSIGISCHVVLGFSSVNVFALATLVMAERGKQYGCHLEVSVCQTDIPCTTSNRGKRLFLKTFGFLT